MSRSFSLILVFVVLLTGCQTTRSQTGTRVATDQEALDAVGSVTGALTGKELTDAEKRKVLHDLQKDKEAQSAMNSISGALEVRQSGIKYCPVDGKRFNEQLDECPDHKVKLKELD